MYQDLETRLVVCVHLQRVLAKSVGHSQGEKHLKKGKLGGCGVDMKQSWIVSNRLLPSLDRAPLDR